MSDRIRLFARPALLLAGLLGAGLLLRLLPEGGVAGLLAHEAGEHGAWQAIDLMLVGAAVCAVGVPRQAVAYACGLALGLRYGVAVAMAAQLVGCAANLLWARLLARDWATRRLRGRLARLDRAIAARPFSVTLSLRLLPVGNNLLLNLAAGVSSVAALPFLAASALGFLPQTLVFALAGAGAQVGHGAQLLLAAALFAVSAALGWWLLRRGQAEAGPGLSADAARSAIPQG
jgi:uncharacterized membrane protein YdjX (TVP38/TMEM64 family)